MFFENCRDLGTSQAVIHLDEYLIGTFNITLKSLNFSYNSRALLNVDFSDSLIILLTGYNYFSCNKGSIIIIWYNYLHFSKADVHFVKNSQIRDYKINDNAPIWIGFGTMSFEHSHVRFINNGGGGILAQESEILFGDNTTVSFNNNGVVQNGGAMSLDSESSLIFNAIEFRILLNFTNNTAAEKGGAIYVGKVESEEECSDVNSIFDIQCDITLVKLTFQDNLAWYAGNQIYGGWVDWISDDESGVVNHQIEVADKILSFQSRSESDIASCPVRICMCKDGHPDCNITTHTTEVYGHSLSIDTVAVGERYTPVIAYIEAILISADSAVRHNSERFPATCTRATYKFRSDKVTIHLTPDTRVHDEVYANINDSMSRQYSALFDHLSIEVKSIGCPLGFALNNRDGSCICEKIQGLNCDIDNIKIRRNDQQWIGVTNEHTKTIRHPGVIVYNPCPFDYCRTDNESLSIRLEDKDMICNFNRSGTLCGGCKTNFSRVLGSSKCKKCTHNILILIAIFLGQAIFGLALVISLMWLDLTVADGTINALTFYANVIHAQQATSFAQNTSSFLSTFIAWLNLEFGIETCLYNGLDEYALTWLKIPFPLYIWFLTGLMIVVSHYSSRFTKFIHTNSVQVLATLFLISYTRLLRLIIDVFSFASLTYPDEHRTKVWLVDGNVEYFKGKHIPLLLITTFYVVVTLPYTFVLLTIQFLYKISHYRVMFWVQKLKPFFDAYTGPYKAKHRYWTGLLLLVRVVLLITFSFFESSNTSVNLMVIIFISFALVGWYSLAGGIYESPVNNFLEMSFLYNLCITSAAVLYDKNNTKVSVFISTSLAFAVFTTIVLGHALKQLLHTKPGSKIKEKVRLFPFKKQNDNIKITHLPSSQPGQEGQIKPSVTSTVVELKQPLLDNEC